MGENYIHGYSDEEQRRLHAQAIYWRDTLILPDLPYREGQSVLDIGCGAGAVLSVLAEAHPYMYFFGIDASAEQIEGARTTLGARLASPVDLRVGDAGHLPWNDASFDHVYMMWFVEHLKDCTPVLAEARRVLKPGGSLACNETDYVLARIWPEHPDMTYLFDAQRALFSARGNPNAGSSIGPRLVEAGFVDVSSHPVGHHTFTDGSPRMRDFADYLLSFLTPMLPIMADSLSLDFARLHAGAAHLRALPDEPSASLTHVVFRTRARVPA